MAYTTIKKPSDYFNTVLYTGDGTSGRTISGVGFKSDFLWIKSRSNATNHTLTDVIRGGDLQLRSNTSDAEAQFGDQDITFTSDGFTNAGSTSNNSGFTFVAWNWLGANGTASNTDGSITSTVSANTTSGFSIVSYTGNGTGGATIGHGLGYAPKMIIVKDRDGADSWVVYHNSLAVTEYMILNSTLAAQTDNEIIFYDTDPTSSVFTVGAHNTVNQSGHNYIAYCFAEVKGFSKFGSYVGNGSADGTFVYTGFKPAWVMVKRIDSTQDWRMFDSTRSSFNAVNNQLKANTSDAETTATNFLDFVSNGAKIRESGASVNESGGTYIYMAFAEEPLVGDNPATAR